MSDFYNVLAYWSYVLCTVHLDVARYIGSLNGQRYYRADGRQLFIAALAGLLVSRQLYVRGAVYHVL